MQLLQKGDLGPFEFVVVHCIGVEHHVHGLQKQGAMLVASELSKCFGLLMEVAGVQSASGYLGLAIFAITLYAGLALGIEDIEQRPSSSRPPRRLIRSLGADYQQYTQACKADNVYYLKQLSVYCTEHPLFATDILL